MLTSEFVRPTYAEYAVLSVQNWVKNFKTELINLVTHKSDLSI